MSKTPSYEPGYKNSNISRLVNRLRQQNENYESQRLIQTRKNRRNHQSCSQMLQSYKPKQRQLFNNKTLKQSDRLFDKKIKCLPYQYIPKEKNDNFIIPDRAFAKGKAAKRFYIKMKDSSVCSFKDNEDQRIHKLLHKTQKQKTIISRQLQQLQRIIDQNDGKLKAKHHQYMLFNSKHFRYTSNNSQLFSKTQPFLQTKEAQNIRLKKMSLTQTFNKTNKSKDKWKYTSKNNRLFSATTNTFIKNQSQLFSKFNQFQ